MTKEKPKYVRPSQRVWDIVNTSSAAGKPMGPADVSILISMALLDKLDEINLRIASFQKPAPQAVPAPEKKS